MRLVGHFRQVLLALSVGVGLAISGCGGSGSGGGQDDPTVRFFNACSDSTNLNFLLDDEVVAPLLGYLEATANFEDRDADSYDLRLQEDGTSVDIWSEVVTLVQGRHYLISAIGLKNYGTENLKRLRFLFNQIDRTAPNGSRARLLIIHGYNRSAGFETPNVDFQTPGDNPQFKASDIAYGTLRNLEVDAGPQTFEVRRAGTENILFSQNVTLVGGKLYAAYIVGVEGEVGAAAPKVVFVEMPTD